MNLKKLEIHGFKSFAEKTKFVFSDGITVVVGPNGSGKSNIADAIRWVLGEQSMKSLRGGKAEDIIFSGANNRKPLGMAEVSLYLSNELGKFPIDFSDVKITRRIYRSGESEYLINDAPCRLKDIYDLIADSGLGKDALAIVGQGMISDILSAKAEDRRGIIEEAAGIVRFRNRKKEAERKLLDTERNLERISDILDNLSERLPLLKEQKEKAEIFSTFQEELQFLEKQLLAQQVTDAGARGEKILLKIISLKDDLLRKETELRVLDAQLEEKRLHVLEDEESITNLQQKLLQATTFWEKIQGSQNLTQEKIFFTDEKLLNLEGSIKLLQKNIHDKSIEQKALKNVIAEKEEYFNSLSARLQDAETQRDKKTSILQSLEEELEKAKEDAFEAAHKLSEAKNNLLQVAKEEEIQNQKSQNTAQKIEELASKLEQYEKELFIKQKSGEDQVKDLQSLLVREKKLQQESLVCQEQYSKLTSSLLEKESALDSTAKQYAFYQEMENKHEGYGHAVRSLFQSKDAGNKDFSKLHGTVADVISVDKKYEVAVEIALGGALQNIIVDSEDDAKKAIAFLKNNHAGRATFLPISVIRPEKAQEFKTYLIAADLIKCDSIYQPIIKFLLGRTLITDDLNAAVKVAKETGHRYKIVTLEGDVISPGGTMSGGSISKKQTSFLSRKRLIEELAQQQLSLKKEQEALEEEIGSSKNVLSGLEDNLVGITESINSLTAEIRERETEAKLIMQSIDMLQKNLQEKHLEQEISLKDRELISQSHQVALEKVAVQEKLYISNTQVVEKFAEELQTLKTGPDFTNELLEIRTELARLEEELKNKLGESKNLLGVIATQNSELATNMGQYKSLLEDKKSLEQEISSMQEEFTRASAQRVDLENRVQTAREQKQQEQMQCFEEEQKLKVIQKQLAVQSEDIHVQEMRLAKIETEKELLLERLQNEYSIVFGEDDIALMPDFNKKAVQERIINLQGEIANLGTVNLGAIEEFAEESSKYEFLKGQLEDLVGAKDSLYKVIRDIDKEMSLKFLETFETVDREFQKVFKQVFGGGNAKLSLTDTENILESGIDIIAQPPGKKLQHLMLLSGGEKALTAIALLFAVLKVKPAPFCVLDEIEAALDETNVSRFAAFLKDYSSETQFIIISHRQGTMEVADTLYGTTMEEQGVTKLISVKFDERMVV